MKPSDSKNGLDGFTTDTVTWLFSNIGFTTDTDRFHHEHRQFHHRYRVLKFARFEVRQVEKFNVDLATTSLRKASGVRGLVLPLGRTHPSGKSRLDSERPSNAVLASSTSEPARE